MRIHWDLLGINSDYNPLGSAAPFVLDGRTILQGICKQNIQWDSGVNSAVKKDWKSWATKLKYVEHLHFKRCIKPNNYG